MSSCIVIPCCKPKRTGKCKASDMYQSPLFKRAKKTALRSGLEWFILSAKYGLIKPDTIIEPYEKIMKSNGGLAFYLTDKKDILTAKERKVIKTAANSILANYSRRIYLMGKVYIEHLLPGEAPLKGLTFSAQLIKLKELDYSEEQ